MIYADIIVDISHEKLDRSFQYRVPKELEAEIQLGMVVTIPFGNGNHERKGYVTGLSDKPAFDISKMKELHGICSSEETTEERLIALAAWMKNRYGSTMVQALKTVLPVREKISVEILCCGGASLFDDARGGAHSVLAGLVDGLLLLLRELAEHPRRQVVIRARFLADADLDAREILASEVINDVFQAILAACRTFRAHSKRADVERNIVRQHDNALWRDFVERRRVADRLAGQIHERLRFKEQHALSAEHSLPRERLELHAVDFLAGTRTIALKRTETSVVARVVVLAAGVAQTDHDPLDRLHRFCGLFFL